MIIFAGVWPPPHLDPAQPPGVPTSPGELWPEVGDGV